MDNLRVVSRHLSLFRGMLLADWFVMQLVKMMLRNCKMCYILNVLVHLTDLMNSLGPCIHCFYQQCG